MEIGMFHEFQCPRGHSEERAFAESFEQVDAAERWGLDCMWLAELHVAPTRSVASAPLIAEYHAAWREAGHPGKGEIYLRVPVYVAETQERAYEEPRASIMQFYQEMASIMAASANAEGTRAVEDRAGRAARLGSVSYDEALREKIIVGTPDQVVARLKALRAELGLNGILAEMNCGAQTPHIKVMRSLELLCKEVMPHVRN